MCSTLDLYNHVVVYHVIRCVVCVEQNSGMSNHGNMKTQEMLEEENDQLMEQMASRVKTLKAVSHRL